MRLLLIKTSSLGDVIHALPALTDVYQRWPQLECHWVVEEAFAEIPRWHPAVTRVIPVALRRWRKHLWSARPEWRQFKQTLTQFQYDWIIDAQGLLKSAFLTWQARGMRHGFAGSSAREPLATWAYQRRYAVAWNQHAVTRVRQLFSHVFNYPCPETPPDYGIKSTFPIHSIDSKRILFLHGTTWATKLWPLDNWSKLARKIVEHGGLVRVPWHGEQEHQRAQRIAQGHPQIALIPGTNLYGMATELAQATGVVGVDTGLAHLAAALAVPTVTLYGATQPAWTGTYGISQHQLQANYPCAPCLRRTCRYPTAPFPPCYADLTVERIWEAVKSVFNFQENGH